MQVRRCENIDLYKAEIWSEKVIYLFQIKKLCSPVAGLVVALMRNIVLEAMMVKRLAILCVCLLL